MESLKFRVDPLSFHLPPSLHDAVLTSAKKQSARDETIFGLSVYFSVDKLKKYRLSGTHKVDFESFVGSFSRFCKSISPAELRAATVRDSRTFGEFGKRGFYSPGGTFLRSFEPSFLRDPNNDLVRAVVERFSQGERSEGTMAKTGKSHSSHEDKDKRNDHERDRRHDSQTSESGEQSHMNDQQAKEMTGEAETMETKNKKLAIRFESFSLGAKQRPSGFMEQHVPVSRGDYSAVTRKIVLGKPGGFVITGPTGCGKSTVALLPLFVGGKSVLVIEPTQANAGNIFHEFRNVLPALYSSRKIFTPVPAVQFIAPTVMKPPYSPLMVTTTQKIVEYFKYYGGLPPVDYIVLDEFHLPIPDMVLCVELLRTFDFDNKYILVSATAVGFKVEPQLPKAATMVYGRLPVGSMPAKLQGSDLDPRRWENRGDGTFAVVAPSLTIAKKLSEQYKAWRIKTYLITRETLVSEYAKAAANFHRRVAFVLEPAVEAGVTLSMSVLVSMGATAAVRYDGKVVLEDTQPLDNIAGIQRGGRAGRVVPTLYVVPVPPKQVAPATSAAYYRAQAVIQMVAAGASPEKMRDEGLFFTFPRLKNLTRKLAISAVGADADPFVALYKRSDSGAVFAECGGSGSGFSTLAKRELNLYHYGRGFYVAPVSDFSDLNSEPDTFVLRDSQLDAALEMVRAEPGLEEKYELDELVGLLVGKFDVYVKDLFVRLRTVFTGSEPTPFSLQGRPDDYPEMRHFLGSLPGLLKLFEYMMTEPPGVKYKIEKGGGSGRPCTQKHSFEYGKLILNFSFPDKYMKSGTLDSTTVAKDVYTLLQGLLAVEILINGAPQRCVDLRNYKGRVSRDHTWFNTHVEKA